MPRSKGGLELKPADQRVVRDALDLAVRYWRISRPDEARRARELLVRLDSRIEEARHRSLKKEQ